MRGFLFGGVLTIGSLYWRKDTIREEWRSSHLSLETKIYVKVPIRYGRLSRAGTMTMVLSKTVETQNRLGRAYVLPFKKEINSSDDIKNEFKGLWMAESNKKVESSQYMLLGEKTIWGVIGVLLNPDINVEKKDFILDICAGYMEEVDYFEPKDFVDDEEPFIAGNGELQIKWPRACEEIDQSRLNSMDFILVTCTKHNVHTKDVVSKAVACIKNSAEAEGYFDENCKNKIVTDWDEEIKSGIK